MYIFAEKENMKNIVGPPVTEDDFFGREKEIKKGLTKLQNGNSLILAAPRRVGKTSFSKKMIELLEKENWLGIYINMEHLKDEMALYEELADKLYAKRSVYERISRRSKKFLEDLSFTIKDCSIKYHDDNARNTIRKHVLEIINDPDREGRILFVLDELAVFLNVISEQGAKIEQARAFLNWLRSVRQESSGKASWIYCSSISIENYLSKYDLNSTTNDMLPFEIGEMPEDEALGLLQQLANGSSYTFPIATQKYILTRLGVALPHNIQGLFSETIDEIPDGKETVTKTIVDNAYNRLVKNANYFATWYQRLGDYSESADLKTILHFMSQNPDSVSEEQLMSLLPDSEDSSKYLSQLLRILQHDGYIIKNANQRYSFRLKPLKDYWSYYSL